MRGAAALMLGLADPLEHVGSSYRKEVTDLGTGFAAREMVSKLRSWGCDASREGSQEWLRQYRPCQADELLQTQARTRSRSSRLASSLRRKFARRSSRKPRYWRGRQPLAPVDLCLGRENRRPSGMLPDALRLPDLVDQEG